MSSSRSRAERGSALLLVLIVAAAVGWAAVLAHHAALQVLQRSRADLSVARARQAAASGLAHASTPGLSTAGTLGGGARWETEADSSQTGFVRWRSRGWSGAGAWPMSESWALVVVGDSGARYLMHPGLQVRR